MPSKPLIDRKNKIIMSWSAKAGCTVAVKMFFHHMGILHKALAHEKKLGGNFPDTSMYRRKVFYKKFGAPTKVELASPKYFKFKVVRNPYTRAVSSYIHAINLKKFQGSFAAFIRKLSRRGVEHSDHHWRQQLRENPKLFDRIVKLENLDAEMEAINKLIGSKFKTNFSSDHHLKKTKVKKFVGHKAFKPEVKKIPDYRYFYNKKILAAVSKLYKADIMAYKYEAPF
jgi:hypothetical protein